MQQKTAHFFYKLEKAFHSEVPFVVYRKPNENRVFAIIQNSNALYVLKRFQESGFVFAPFSKTDKKVLFPAKNTESFSVEIQNFDALPIIFNSTQVESVLDKTIAEKQHIELVKNTLNFIKKKEAEKIVVSRKEVLASAKLDLFNSYKKMLKKYQNAMVYLWFHPKVGCWMGASPERLLHCKNNKFKTMALAGTQSFNGEITVDWKEKEQIEQQFVTDYILKVIKESVNDVVISKPYTIKAGSLLHLRTDIEGSILDSNALENLINSLHPTPAVCGLPKKTATDFILKNEGYNRSFYSGYLGELNIDNESNLFVNLRCMQVQNNEISIYIGGGITASSRPEKEWEETVFKAQIMKSIL